MHVLSLFVLVVPVLATPVVQTGQQYEPVSFNNCELVLDHNVDTYVVGMRFTLEPANVACAASNFSMPSPTFSCADIGYAFSINKTEGYYSRYTVRISHKLMSRCVNKLSSWSTELRRL